MSLLILGFLIAALVIAWSFCWVFSPILCMAKLELWRILCSPNHIPDANFLAVVVTVEAVLIGVTVPVSLQVVTWMSNQFKDPEIAKEFTKEKLYWTQYPFLFINIIAAVVIIFLQLKLTVVMWFILSWVIFNIIWFYFFIRLVQKYATDTKKVMLDKLTKYVQEIIEI